MASVVENREWYLASYAAEGVPNLNHLKIRTIQLSLALDSIPDSHVALETLFLSVEPYLRARMTGTLDGLYFEQFQLNRVISINSFIFFKKKTKGEIITIIRKCFTYNFVKKKCVNRKKTHIR